MLELNYVLYQIVFDSVGTIVPKIYNFCYNTYKNASIVILARFYYEGGTEYFD